MVAAAADRLKITEVFHSLQGEASSTGWPTVFIRLTGCPLRCQYCDTAYAFGGGEWRSVSELVREALAYGARHVCVTGGEPLAQPRCLDLLTALCDLGLEVSLETSGAIDISPVDPRVCRVVDIKTPGSREVERNLEANLEVLHETDVLKFVICDRVDYDWAKHWLDAHPNLPCEAFFSPSYEELAGRELADWILEDRLDVRLQLQLHKLLWGNVPGH
ncbi:MAG TPA: 7-carboxy-7-deazaguanine synthase QueE [Gammaproteobacteria bacterium]|nr:7-carboxy-7-deazaguanine synthase QueE [Gammaproteobacteria bacterium]